MTNTFHDKMETRKRNQLSNNGADKGEYNDLLIKPEWKNKRLIIMNRDNNNCRNCGCSNDLQVHHKQYHKRHKDGDFKKPWEYKENYLITLCKACHQDGHKSYIIPIFYV